MRGFNINTDAKLGRYFVNERGWQFFLLFVFVFVAHFGSSFFTCPALFSFFAFFLVYFRWYRRGQGYKTRGLASLFGFDIHTSSQFNDTHVFSHSAVHIIA